MFVRLSGWVIAVPRSIIAGATFILLVSAIMAIPVSEKLSAGGFGDPTAESSRAAADLAGRFNQGNMQLLLTVSAPGGVSGTTARSAGTEIIEKLKESPHVAAVKSPWTETGYDAAALTSKDGISGLIVAGINGDENSAQRYASELAEEVAGTRDGVTVKAGGDSILYAQIREQSEKDLLLMEALALPLILLALLWVFGGVVAAGLPLVVAAVAITLTAAALRLLTLITEVSVFALSLASALGLALAIDYTLLIISRFRDEMKVTTSIDEAIMRTMATAGRTVVFSAATVAMAIAPMVLFPMGFLRSIAYSAMIVVMFAAVSAVILTPAAIKVLGTRVESGNIKPIVNRILRNSREAQTVEGTFWYRNTKSVMKRPFLLATIVAAALLLLGTPFVGVKFGFPDDRVLSSDASVRQVGDQLRSDFNFDPQAAISIVVSGVENADSPLLDDYAVRLSRVDAVKSVATPTGNFIGGVRVTEHAAEGSQNGDAIYLTVASAAPLFSQESNAQLDSLHAVSPPQGTQVAFTGTAQINKDSVAAVTSRLPMVLALIAIITALLLFAATGSLVLPIKAVAMNMLSLAAAFGALVWVFQNGNLWALGTTSVGTLNIQTPLVLFFIAFGVSMDYEVFILARIREYWLRSDRSEAANSESVAKGLAHTGPVVTAAAAIMAVSFAALIAAQVSTMKMLGLGLLIVVLVDATLVRMLLVPAFMKMMGLRNWWAPKRVNSWFERRGIGDDNFAPIKGSYRVASLTHGNNQ